MASGLKINKTGLIADLTCILSLGCTVLYLTVYGQPRILGFYCQNEDIHYPYQPSTVSNYCLIVTSLFLPNIVIVLANLKNNQDKHGVFNKKSLVSALFESYGTVAVFWLGLGFTQITVDTAKYNIGRLRPHFIAVCRPNVNCTQFENLGKYISKYECTGSDLQLIKNSRESFPSGHAALAFYSAVYIAIYLKQRNGKANRCVPVATAVTQIFLLQIAWFTSLSRISDNMHHWSDVLVGAITGTTYACFMMNFIKIPNNRLILIDEEDQASKEESRN